MAVDESVQKLAEFCALLKQTNAQIGQQTTALDEQEGKLDDVDEQQLGALGDEISKQVESLATLAGQAEDGVERIGAEADGMIADELEQGSQAVGDAGDGFEQALDRDTGALDQHFEELRSQGFTDAQDALGEAAERADSLAGEADGTFEELENGLDELTGDLEEARGATAQSLDEAAQALRGDEASGLEGGTTPLVAEWQGLPAELAGECGEIGGALESAYTSFRSDNEDVADNLVSSVAELGREAAEAVSEQGTRLGQEADAAEGALSALDEEGGNMQETMEAGATTSEALLPVLEEMVTALAKVDEIDELLNALG
jgi:hypothetical protein